MKQLFQSRLQQKLQERGEYQGKQPAYPAAAWEEEPPAVLKKAERALLFIDTDRTMFAVSPSAAALLDVAAETVRGKSLDTFADGALGAIALRRNATYATTTFALPDGRTLFARTRLVTGRDEQFSGWVVELEEMNTAQQTRLDQHQAVLPDVSMLLQQIQTMQELITMLPQFSQHRSWQHLLVEHVEQLISQMDQALREPLSMQHEHE